MQSLLLRVGQSISSFMLKSSKTRSARGSVEVFDRVWRNRGLDIIGIHPYTARKYSAWMPWMLCVSPKRRRISGETGTLIWRSEGLASKSRTLSVGLSLPTATWCPCCMGRMRCNPFGCMPPAIGGFFWGTLY